VARAGDKIVSSTDLYGGTWNLFAHTLKDQGDERRFIDPADPDNFRRATDDPYACLLCGDTAKSGSHGAEVAEIGRPRRFAAAARFTKAA
jgi:O-acetylhomoserine (thiol)-lyase